MRVRAGRSGLLLVFAAAFAGVGGAGCINLDDITTVKDLRVLAVQADTPGFLVNLDDPGSATDAELAATITALVVDPKAPGGAVTVSATGCPDFLDAITAATGRATKLCAPGQPGTVDIAPAAPSTGPETSDLAAKDIEYHPALVPFGLTSTEVALLFTQQAGASPTIAQAIQYNRDYGIDAIVNMTFTLGAEQASVVKRLVYWPDLRASFPDEVPNQNPHLDRIEFYRDRDKTTGDPIDKWDDVPTVSIGARDKLYVLPVPAADAVETYPLRSLNTQTKEVETKLVQELLVFDFFTTAGTFSPPERRNQPPIFSPPGSPIHIDSQLNLPTVADLAKLLPPSGLTDVWVVVHDERAGVSWLHAAVNIVP